MSDRSSHDPAPTATPTATLDDGSGHGGTDPVDDHSGPG